MRNVTFTTALTFAALTSGCAYNRVTQHHELHDKHPQQVRAKALMGSDPNLAAVCDGHPPAEHRARATALDTAAAVLSFGIIVPVTVEYSCAHGEPHVPPPTAAVLADAADAPLLSAEHRPPPPVEVASHAEDHHPAAAPQHHPPADAAPH